MEKIRLTILGSGSALPQKNAFHASQILEVCGSRYMIDCGEGCQIKLIQYGLMSGKLNNIFISHLHADHCIGLPGLIATMAMLGRKEDLHVYAYKDLEQVMLPMIDYFKDENTFNVVFHAINPKKREVIYEDKHIMVETIPLKHRVPTCGFLFKEQPKKRHLITKMLEAFDVPIRERQEIKDGADFVDSEGNVIENSRLTTPPKPQRSYAYISDTLPYKRVAEQIKGVDCMFHEATFLESESKRAKETMHTTAKAAAEIAAATEAKRLILGHFSARYKKRDEFLAEAKPIFPATILAEDGLKIEF